ncbi:MAG: hypothetical protein GWN79_23375, partial [Actinobacteria bacterium]|nr:hypothetical protein [Actinomycetota bacterium]NIU21813.1 hypothetical protein [Actinomycetota bacterium]NIX53158.1 hypothetical protein [Actinomycetota bacterium]
MPPTADRRRLRGRVAPLGPGEHHSCMDREFALATDSADVRAVQGLRYDVYVEEMGRYRVAADHDRRLLVEPEDESGFL